MFFSLPAAAQGQPEILAGPIINPANGHSYYLLAVDTWQNSENRAVAMGGHLVTINNQAEQDWVYNTIGSFGDLYRPLWIGLSDAANEGTFQWVSGESLDYTKWGPNEPSNSGADGEDFVQMLINPNYQHLGTWNDLPNQGIPHPVYDPYGVVEVESEPSFLRDGLVAYYPLDGNANDESGNEYDGTVSGAVPTTDRFGELDKAYAFRGAQSIQLPGRLSWTNTTGLTLAMWAKVDPQYTLLCCNTLIDMGDGVGDTYRFGISIDTRVGTYPIGWGGASTPEYPRKTWAHFAITYAPDGLRVFVNGVVAASNNWPRTLNLPVTPERQKNLGSSSILGNSPLYGDLDDVHIFSRTLTEWEVKGLYDYESRPAPQTAKATPQVVNGFVVGVTVTNGGVDYTDAPNVIISGGGGSGATAIATVANGKVTAITVQNPGSGYTGTPTVIIAPPPIPVRLATATLQVVNGFVVGATITDKGSGYTNAPSVTITGGGGSGATAIASISYPYGEVTSITIQNTGSGYTGPTTITIASPPFPPRTATGTSSLVNGFVVGATLADGGFGYKLPPEVRFVGGGGSGASAVATILDNTVTSIRIINPGSGYTSAPEVRFGNPTHPLRAGVRLAPGTGNAAGKVRLTMDLMPGMRYQLESSANLYTWTPTGAILATPEKTVTQELDVNQVGQFFRIKQAP